MKRRLFSLIKMRRICLLALVLFNSSLAGAEIARYVDDQGNVHYTNNLEKVPEEYKAQLNQQKPLPQIGKVPAIKAAPSGKAEYSAAAAQKGKVEVYVADWCPHCRELEQFLKSRKIPYSRRDLEKDEAAARAYSQLGRPGIPVIKIGSKVIIGFKREELLEALGGR
jgi:glutaredoxin